MLAFTLPGLLLMASELVPVLHWLEFPLRRPSLGRDTEQVACKEPQKLKVLSYLQVYSRAPISGNGSLEALPFLLDAPF